jgi:hypothetical protein
VVGGSTIFIRIMSCQRVAARIAATQLEGARFASCTSTRRVSSGRSTAKENHVNSRLALLVIYIWNWSHIREKRRNFATHSDRSWCWGMRNWKLNVKSGEETYHCRSGHRMISYILLRSVAESLTPKKKSRRARAIASSPFFLVPIKQFNHFWKIHISKLWTFYRSFLNLIVL